MHLSLSVPVPHIQEQIVEAIKVIPQEQMAERIVEQIVDVLMPQIQVQFVDVPVHKSWRRPSKLRRCWWFCQPGGLCLPGGEWPLPPEGTAGGCRALRRRSVDLVAAGLGSDTPLVVVLKFCSGQLCFPRWAWLLRLGRFAWAAALGPLRACCCGGVLEVPMVCI